MSDEFVEPSLDQIAYQDDDGNWRAGPDNSKGLNPGQFIDSTYAKRARGVRKYWNDVKRAQFTQEQELDEARDTVSEYREKKRLLKEGELSQEEFNEFIQDTFGS